MGTSGKNTMLSMKRACAYQPCDQTGKDVLMKVAMVG